MTKGRGVLYFRILLFYKLGLRIMMILISEVNIYMMQFKVEL